MKVFHSQSVSIDSDNGSEFIIWELFLWCEQEKLTFTRSRSGNKNGEAHVEQKNWHVIRQVVGYHRYDSTGELDLLNKIWQHQHLLTNHFAPQQKLIAKERNSPKISKKYEKPATPYQRALADDVTVLAAIKKVLTLKNKRLNPAEIQRQIQTLTNERLTLTTPKQGSKNQPATRALSNDSSTRSRRAS